MEGSDDRLAWLDSLQGSGIRPGLARTRELLARAGSPEQRFLSVIVAGTNGKGSTASTLASILRESGYRTGLYTSPHLIDIRERWIIDGAKISPEALVSAIGRLRAAAECCPFTPTYFEALTVTAFIAFEAAACEVAVLEVGMGGRLDATNVVQPAAALITTVGMDHTEFLGTTIEEIAAEKAGVIHEGSVAVTSNSDSRVLGVLKSRAVSVGTELHVTLDETKVEHVAVDIDRLRFRLTTPVTEYRIESPLTGEHQTGNIVLAVRGAELLMFRMPKITPASIAKGVGEVSWRGRLERFEAPGKSVFVDGGHNSNAADEIARFVGTRLPPPRTLVFGMMSDKDVESTAAKMFPLFERIVLTRPDPERAMSLDDLEAIVGKLGRTADRFERPSDAIAHALSLEPPVVAIFGSLYLAGAAVEYLDRIADPAAARSSSIDENNENPTIP